MKLKAITVIDDGKTQIKPGTIFDRPQKEAEDLIKWGAAEAPLEPNPEPESADPEPEVTTSKEEPQNGTARDPLTGLPTD